MARSAEEPAVLAELESIARGLGDPLILTQALQLRIYPEFEAERRELAAAVADEALPWARAAGDEWEIAETLRRRAIAASSPADLRDGVDTAASLLADVGNVHGLGDLLTDATYAALRLGSERDAIDFATRAAPIIHTLADRFTQMLNTGTRGLAALLTGDIDTALHAFRDEPTLCRDIVARRAVSEGLRGLAAVAVIDGEFTRAATLVGAAATHRYDKTEDSVEIRLDETFFEPAPSRHGADAWAIAYALEEAAWIHRSGAQDRPPNTPGIG